MNRFYLLLLAFFVCAAFTAEAQTTVSGTIMDSESSETLIGANVVIRGTTKGTVTDVNGKFSLTSNVALPWILDISYTGYSSQEVEVTSATSDLSIKLVEGTTIGSEIVISASRRAEKVQDAPASITVLNARKLEASPNENPVRNLISAPGVSIQQQSAARINIQLRGDGGIFGSASFPILDYRSLSGPGLGTFDALNSPLNNIDIDRIEVVRGPGSALYGPGVTAGVVHFISKSPIDKPGTTVQLVGGELNTIGISARHATKVSDKFGFKINAVYKQGDDFGLDASNPEDAARIANLQDSIYFPGITNGIVDATKPGRLLLNKDQVDVDGDGNPMQAAWSQTVLTGALEFRPADDLSVNVAGGFNTASAVFFNSQGEGLNQANEFWGQARMQKGGLFAQVFYLTNNGGSDEKPTFLYQTGNYAGIGRTQLEGQLQYNFDMDFLNSNWTTGIDYRNSTANTQNTVYGRFEDDDDFGIIGAYLQGKLELMDKLDFVVAARGDRFNFTDEFAFSPRAVFVYKPAPTHTVRFGFNRAVSSPTQLQVNIDFPVSTVVPGAFDIWLRGNKTEQTFDNPVIKLNGAFGGAELPIETPGLPNAVTYGAVSANVLAQLIPGIEAQAGAALAGAIQAYLTDPANAPGGTTGNFVGINLFNGKPLGVTNAPAAQLRIEDTWEIGYKGLIGKKLGASLDIYNRTIDGATLFTAISPSYTLANSENIAADLGAAVGTQALEDYIFGLLEANDPGNPVNGPTAAGLRGIIGGAYTAGGAAFAGDANVQALIAGAAVASTPTDQMPDDGVTHVAAGYRTFEKYSYTGIDLGLEYYINADLSAYFNYSFISDNVFTPVIKGTEADTETTSLSAPQHKFRIGGNYSPELGLRANLSFQYDQSYTAFLGQYSGETGDRALVDLGVGYKFDFGLTVSISAQNLLNNKYRAFPNMPMIGRRTLVTATYDFGNGKK